MFHVSFQTRFQILVDVAESKWFLECINNCSCRDQLVFQQLYFLPLVPLEWLVVAMPMLTHASSHLPAPPPLTVSSPLIAPLSGISSGWLLRLCTPHTDASHLPAPPPLIIIVPTPLVTPLLGLLSGWLSCHLSSSRHLTSAGASAFFCTIASCAYTPPPALCQYPPHT